ncbi:long-chain fatty acid--CoA ligase [Pseudonocardia ailaonensis]|uniref:Long-chain fatty acid--CoA ligase n=1 Tax=Pseudonocardia ailaonensis TaxID=367279 RepID=A0ABN2N3I9_9PSEU
MPNLSGIVVADWVTMGARQHPGRPCIVMGDGSSRSYAEIEERITRLGSAMTAHGVTRGARIALLATDSAEYLETMFVCAKLGAAAIPLNYRQTVPELAVLLDAGRATWLFVTRRYLDMAVALRDRVSTLETIVLIDGEADGVLGYEALVAEGSPEPWRIAVDDEEILLIAFTSGTTGNPKGVMQSHRMYKRKSVAGAVEYRVRQGAFRYSAAPLHHVGGSGMVFQGLSRGASTLILPQFGPEDVVEWLGKGLNSVFLVPTMISRILALPGIRDARFPALESIVYGAAPMPPSLLAAAMEVFDCDFYNGFGAGTEAGMQAVLGPEEHRRALAGETHLLQSIGKPGVGVDLRLVDDDWQDVEPGETGEIASRSEHVMSGYLDQPERTAQVFHEGWFRGGDLAHFDAEGYLYFDGRKDDMILRGGENIYPIEIEDVLSSHPSVREVAVVGIPDEHWGQIVRACLVPGEGYDEDALRSYCRERLAGYKVPAEFRVHAELPRNPNGKILKRRLRQEVTS